MDIIYLYLMTDIIVDRGGYTILFIQLPYVGLVNLQLTIPTIYPLFEAIVLFKVFILLCLLLYSFANYFSHTHNCSFVRVLQLNQ